MDQEQPNNAQVPYEVDITWNGGQPVSNEDWCEEWGHLLRTLNPPFFIFPREFPVDWETEWKGINERNRAEIEDKIRQSHFDWAERSIVAYDKVLRCGMSAPPEQAQGVIQWLNAYNRFMKLNMIRAIVLDPPTLKLQDEFKTTSLIQAGEGQDREITVEYYAGEKEVVRRVVVLVR